MLLRSLLDPGCQLIITFVALGDSESMVCHQRGDRIKQLQRLLNTIASVYSLAREQGIVSVRFLNAPKGKKNVNDETVKTVLKDHDYLGITRVGTGLKEQIVDKFVRQSEMSKPLLVIVITDNPVGHMCFFPFAKPDGALSRLRASLPSFCKA